MISEGDHYHKIVLNLNNTERIGIKTRKARPMPWWFQLAVARRCHEARVRQMQQHGTASHPRWGAYGRKLG